MRCEKCGRKTKLLSQNGEAVCDDCAKKLGYTICLESGKYKDFECDNICSDCILK